MGISDDARSSIYEEARWIFRIVALVVAMFTAPKVVGFGTPEGTKTAVIAEIQSFRLELQAMRLDLAQYSTTMALMGKDIETLQKDVASLQVTVTALDKRQDAADVTRARTGG